MELFLFIPALPAAGLEDGSVEHGNECRIRGKGIGWYFLFMRSFYHTLLTEELFGYILDI